MDITNEIPKIKQAIAKVDEAYVAVSKLEKSRSVSLAITKLEEAKLWLKYRQESLEPAIDDNV